MAKIEFKTLEQFMPYWCQKILPAVYDDSLSYYQLLGRILQKYNEVIEIVNKHSETLVDHENRITAAEAQIELNRQAIEALKAELAKLDEQVKQNTANIAALTERVNGHDEAIAALQTWINNYKTFLGSHQAIIDSTTHDMSLSIYNTMTTVPWSKWNDVALNGGDSFTIISGGKAVGILSLTVLSAGKFGAFGAIIENDDLHYFRATYIRQGTTANQGGTDDWKEVELLDITNIKQALGNSTYDTISQKVLTQLINSKLNHDMGITGATAGQYINIAEVDDDGKPLRYGFGTPGGGGSALPGIVAEGTMSGKFPTKNVSTRTLTIKIPVVANDIASACAAVLAIGQLKVNLKFKLTEQEELQEYPYIIAPPVFSDPLYIMGCCGSFGYPVNVGPSTGSNGCRFIYYWCYASSFENNLLTMTGLIAYGGEVA